MTDALNRFTVTSYDANNNPITTTDPKGQTTQYRWATGHQLLTRTEQSGRLTTYRRNGLGQVTALTYLEANAAYGYDTAHRLITVTDQRANKTLSYRYSPGGFLDSLTDSDGRITQATDRLGKLRDYYFDANGNPVGQSLHLSVEAVEKLKINFS